MNATVTFDAAKQVVAALENALRCRIGADGKPMRLELRDPTDYLEVAMDALMKLHGGPLELLSPVRPLTPPLYFDAEGNPVR